MEKQPLPHTYSVAALAQRWNIGHETLIRWARAKRVPGAFVLPSGQWRFLRARIDAFEGQANQARAHQ